MYIKKMNSKLHVTYSLCLIATWNISYLVVCWSAHKQDDTTRRLVNIDPHVEAWNEEQFSSVIPDQFSAIACSVHAPSRRNILGHPCSKCA